MIFEWLAPPQRLTAARAGDDNADRILGKQSRMLHGGFPDPVRPWGYSAVAEIGRAVAANTAPSARGGPAQTKNV